jgi:hypothetical protein
MSGDKGFYSASVPASISDSIAIRNAPAGEDASLGSGTVNLLRTYALHKSGTALTNVEPLVEEPVFRKPGEFREAEVSPTIDAGSTTVEPGELDLDGNLRKIGPKTDLGAYEFVPDPPTVGTPSVTRTSATSATVSVPINPNSGRTYYHLEYGPSVAYDTSTATGVVPASTSPATVEFALSGLPTNLAAHFAIVATSDGGETRTQDATIAIPPAGNAPPTTVTPPAPGKLSPKLSFPGGKGSKPGQPLLDRSAIKLSTGCGPVACAVSVVGKVTIDGKTVGTLPGPKTPSHWQAGKQGAIKLRVSSKLKAAVRKALEADAGARAKILVTATYVTAAGVKATRKLTIAVRPL